MEKFYHHFCKTGMVNRKSKALLINIFKVVFVFMYTGMHSVYAQTYVMGTAPAGNNSTVTIPANTTVTLYDDGGAAGDYANNLDLRLTFTAPVGYQIRVTFTQSEFAGNNYSQDYLRVIDGINAGGAQQVMVTMGGNGDVPMSVVSTTEAVSFRLRSDAATTNAGFTATLQTIPVQVYELNATNQNQTFNTNLAVLVDDGGANANYSNNQDRYYTFCSTDGTPIIFDLLKGSNDFGDNFDTLFVYDGASTNAPLIGYINDLDDERNFASNNTGNCLTIRLKTNGANTASGFRGLVYSANHTDITYVRNCWGGMTPVPNVTLNANANKAILLHRNGFFVGNTPVCQVYIDALGIPQESEWAFCTEKLDNAGVDYRELPGVTNFTSETIGSGNTTVTLTEGAQIAWVLANYQNYGYNLKNSRDRRTIQDVVWHITDGDACTVQLCNDIPANPNTTSPALNLVRTTAEPQPINGIHQFSLTTNLTSINITPSDGGSLPTISAGNATISSNPNGSGTLTITGGGTQTVVLNLTRNTPATVSLTASANGVILDPSVFLIYKPNFATVQDFFGIGNNVSPSATANGTFIVICTKPVASATPKVQTICVGGTASAFTAAPNTGVEYKWYGPLADTTNSLGTAISGATSTTFTPTGSALTVAGTKYFAVIVNTTGNATCSDTAFVKLVVNAKPTPVNFTTASVCVGAEVTYPDPATTNGTWTGPGVTDTGTGATVNTTTALTQLGATAPKTFYIYYTQTSSGCTQVDSAAITVKARPVVTITGPTVVCATDLPVTFTGTPAGGTFTLPSGLPAGAVTQNNNVLTLNAGFNIATLTFSYSYTDATTNCSASASHTITVNPKPNAGPDAALVCQPTKTAKLTALTTGGTWAPIGSPANPSAASIDANGNITGLNAAGTYRFVYSITSGGQTCTDTAQVVVNAKPNIADGSATICAGESVNLTSRITNYATYLSPVWTVGTASGTAVATPTSVTPTGTMTYVLVAQNAAGCKDTANVVVTVNAKPNAGKDTTLVCVNAATNTLATSYTLVPSPAGGTWAQLGTTPATATITGNNVTGMTVAGTYQFIYTTTAGCKDTVAVTVAPCAGCVKPNAGSDAATVCQPTSTAKLTALTTGGTWAPIGSPANPSAASIDANGNITGLNAAGTYRFVYSITSGGQPCTDTAQVVVNAKPNIADGSATICEGESVNLTSRITNYATYLSPVWTVGTASGTTVATPTSVKPTGTTTYVLVAQNAAGCKDTANVVVTVNAKPSAGKDTTLVCSNGNVPASVQLAATPTGGTWSALAGNPTGAMVNSSGLVSITNATAQGKSFDFIYLVNGCQDTVKVIVPTCPAPCVASSVTLSNAPVCSADAQTYSFSFTVNNKLGIVKVNKGTLSGNNPYTITGIPSGASVTIIDSLSAVCKSDTIIVGPNCNCNPAMPQLLTPSLTACIGDTFPTLKATVVGLATVEWFSQQTGGTVLATGLSFKPSGTVSANAVFYAQARSTDPTCPTAVSTSRVPATINAQTCIDTIDLALKKSINTKIARVGDVLTYTIKVWNEWTKNATGVEVVDSIATTVQFVSGSFLPSRGSATISGNVIKWNIGNIAANGDTVTLRYQVRATTPGVHLNTAEISKANEKDRDSTPGNGKGGEDDIDQQCFTVPFDLCPTQKLEVSVPANLTNVQWFKNGGSTAVATGNVVLFSEVGVYTFTATNQTCPANGCCPVIIEAGTNCCPVDICVPFTVKKKRK